MNKIQRLLFSLAWRLFKYANLNIKTASGLKIPMRNRGDFASLQEIYVHRSYDPFFEHLKNVRGWVDLGCNAGILSLALYDSLGRPKDVNALLVDAGDQALSCAREAISLNGLADKFGVLKACVGPNGKEMVFYESKSTTRSSLNHPGSVEKTTRVHCRSLRSILYNYHNQSFDLIKIDIEGGEKFIIPEETEILKQFKYGLVEWHAESLRGQDLFAWIRKNGFVILHQSEPETAKLGMVLWKT